MIALSIRTDSDLTELALYQDKVLLAKKKWPAARELSKIILDEISALVTDSGHSLKDIEGLIVFKGPGSFTGLRIGTAVANSVAYALSIPIVGSDSENWVETGLAMLRSEQNQTIVVPEYGRGPNITPPRR